MNAGARPDVVPATSSRPVAGSQNATPKAVGRLHALDFTKGALVLFMVLYHWLNYFYGFKHDIYKYLRFLSPSFVFISGFLISHVYLSRLRADDRHVSQRLMQRGFKILAVFTVLNLFIAAVDPSRSLANFLSSESLTAIYITGNTVIFGVGKLAAFQVLVPIGLLLILSAGLLAASRVYAHIFYVACLVFLVGVFVLYRIGFDSANVDVLALGLVGVLAGYAPVAKLDNMNKHPLVILAAYLGYLIAITEWNVRYPLQVVGVCLTLMILYLLGSRAQMTSWLVRRIIVLGKYSLFAYIAQMVIVQGLHRGLARFGSGYTILAASFIAAFVLTTVCIEALDLARRKATVVDRLYRAVFA